MNKVKSIARIALLYFLLAMATVCIFSEPLEENWMLLLIVSKTIGLSSAFIFFKLIKRWKNDTYLRKIGRIFDIEE